MVSSLLALVVAACPEPQSRCAEDPHAIVGLVKTGNVTAYRFCDGTKAIQSGAKVTSVQVPTSMGDAQKKYTAKEAARLEIAEHNQKVLHTDATQHELAEADAAYQKRSREFFKAQWKPAQYEAAIKQCQVK